MAIQEQVGIKVGVDASQARGEFQRLADSVGNVRKRTDEAESGFSKFMSGASKGIGAVSNVLSGANQVFDLFAKGAKLATERLQEQAQAAQLAERFGKVWINTLSDISRRYVDDDDIIKKALQSTRGELALNQTQFELAAKAAGVLADKGHDYNEALDALVKGFRGQTRAVKEYGIAVRETGDDQLTLNDYVRQLNKINEEGAVVAPGLRLLQEQQAQLRDALDAWKDVLAKFFIWFTGKLQDAIEIAKGGFVSPTKTGSGMLTAAERIARGEVNLDPEEQQYLNDVKRGMELQAADEFVLAEGRANQLIKPRRPGRGGDRWKPGSQAGGFGGLASLQGAPTLGGSTDINWLSPAGGNAAEWSIREDNARRQATPTGSLDDERLERLGDAMDKLRDRTKPAGAAMGAFTDSIAAAVDAAISGGDSIGKAMAKAAAQSLRATAIEASVKAIWETAQGVAMLATGYGAAAALPHFKAAGLYAATAVAAGAGSSLLGGLAGGGGGATAAAGASPGSAGGGYIGPRGGKPETESVTVIVNGDIYDADALAEKVSKAMDKRAWKYGSGGSVVLRQ